MTTAQPTPNRRTRPPVSTARRADRPRIGAALGGGAAHGLAHIPILETLDEMGLAPAEIVGTSMGAVIGAMYAAGMKGGELRDYALDVFSSRSAFLTRVWKTFPKRFSEISIGIGQYNLERVLAAFLPETLPNDFAELQIPFRAIATDYYSGAETVLATGPLRPAIAASAAVPMLFRPISLGGRVLIDGGVCNPVPFDVLTSVDLIIAVDVVTEPSGNPTRTPRGLESLFGATSLLMRSLVLEKLKGPRRPDIFVRPPTGGFNVLDFTRVGAIIKAGEAAQDDLRRRLTELIENKGKALPPATIDHRSLAHGRDP